MAVRTVVGVASALLALSLIEAFRPDDSSLYDGFWGVVAVVLGGLALARGRGPLDQPSHRPAPTPADPRESTGNPSGPPGVVPEVP